MKFFIPLILIAVVAVLLFVFVPSTDNGSPYVEFLTPEPARVHVEIADEPAERSQGLMFRESLGENSGMLFIFEKEGTQSFWMKNTLIPLDMIFIDKDLEIVKIHRDTKPCEEDPCQIYGSGKPAMYVVEVNAGFTETHGIYEGDTVRISL
jgi:uncharacterized membrane protein (UPF0127 family)